VRFEVTVISLKMAIRLDVMLYSSLDVYQHFREKNTASVVMEDV
jgi:hypothetical protein